MSRKQAGWALLGALAASVAVVLVVATHSSTTATRTGPRMGDPCRRLHEYPATFVREMDGSVTASFAFAGGAAHGSVTLSPADASMARTHAGYVTDVQLGSYEPATPGEAGTRLVCRVEPTYHFFCPATNTLEQLCFTWAGAATTGRLPE